MSYVDGNESESEHCTPQSQGTDSDGLNEEKAASKGRGGGGCRGKSSTQKRGHSGADSDDSGEASDWSDSDASGSDKDEDDDDDRFVCIYHALFTFGVNLCLLNFVSFAVTPTALMAMTTVTATRRKKRRRGARDRG